MLCCLNQKIKDFKGKTIIYMWFNKVTGDVYVGSGLDGGNRLISYLATSVLTSTKNSLIYNSLLKYGHHNFNLIILEECGVSTNIEEKGLSGKRKLLYHMSSSELLDESSEYTNNSWV